MTEGEQRAILKTSGEHARGFRDHVIFSMALGTALREHEILALNVGDVFGPDDQPRRDHQSVMTRTPGTRSAKRLERSH